MYGMRKKNRSSPEIINQTHRRKLVIAPAPAAASVKWYKGSFSWGGRWDIWRMRFWIPSYDKNTAPVSSIAPETGAGRPYIHQLWRSQHPKENVKKSRTLYNPFTPSFFHVCPRQSTGPLNRAVTSRTWDWRRTLVKSNGCSKTFDTMPASYHVENALIKCKLLVEKRRTLP